MAPVIFLAVGDLPYPALMVQSVKALGYPCIQLSDEETAEIPGVDEVIRRPQKVPLMLFRLEHLAHFPGKEWITVDADILMRRGVEDVWEKDFDVALTRRGEKEKVVTPNGYDVAKMMPLLMGFMVSRNQEFWKEAHLMLQVQDQKWHMWWGDAMAVCELAKRGTYKVLELPTSEFNWSPNAADETSDLARVVHYKGPVRKYWMLRDGRLS
jgi:hypothetical protein